MNIYVTRVRYDQSSSYYETSGKKITSVESKVNWKVEAGILYHPSDHIWKLISDKKITILIPTNVNFKTYIRGRYRKRKRYDIIEMYCSWGVWPMEEAKLEVTDTFVSILKNNLPLAKVLIKQKLKELIKEK